MTSMNGDQKESPEDLLVMLESLSHGQPASVPPEHSTGVHRLYHPVQPVVMMLLPNREACQVILEFSLSHLAWVHCGVCTSKFYREHQRFWDEVEVGDVGAFGQHGWIAIYLGLLASGYLYMDPEQRPPLPRLSQLRPSDEDPGLALARLWYEAALDELEASRPLAHADVRTVQTIAILTLCHSHFGRTDQEYLLLGTAIHTARCLDMHLLGSEASISKRVSRRPEWLTFEDRQMGRRLWWTLVVCDWLGMLTRPSSISLAGFNTTLETSWCDMELLFENDTSASITVSDRSPLWHLQVMARLATIIYSNIKAPRDLDETKLAAAVDQIEQIHRQVLERRNANPTLHYAPWIVHQEYLVLCTIEFLRLTVARAILSRSLRDAAVSVNHMIDKGVEAAMNILRMRQQLVPRYFQCSWIVSAATLASGVFLAVHLICFKKRMPIDQCLSRRNAISDAANRVQYPFSRTRLAVQGSQLLEHLLLPEKMNKYSLMEIVSGRRLSEPLDLFQPVPDRPLSLNIADAVSLMDLVWSQDVEDSISTPWNDVSWPLDTLCLSEI